MKNRISLFFALIVTFIGTSQVKNADGKLDRTIHDWTSLIANEIYTIDYKFLDCDPEIGYNKEVVALRFVNKSDQKIQISWHSHLFYNGKCKTCAYPEEYSATIELNPNETLASDCAQEGDQERAFFSRFIDPGYKGNALLTDFKLHNVQVKVIK